METKRYRDIVRKASINGDYMIIGVEHQSTLDKNMIIRILNYDAQLYINQVERGKEVYPVGTFVFYTGDKEWTYPKSLKESLKVPPEMEDYINDWKLPVLELQNMDPQILKSKRLKEVVEIRQSMLEGDYEKLRTNRMISVENYKMASILTHTDIKEEDLPEGDEINMCKAMDQLFQRFENQGIEKGEAIGIEKTLKDVNLWDEKDKKYSTYSLGMKQKLGIAQVLMEDPTVMIFDEPFNGIDEESKKKIRKLLKKLKDKIIIIATHEKEDIERLTNVTYEIKEGKIIQKK